MFCPGEALVLLEQQQEQNNENFKMASNKMLQVARVARDFNSFNKTT